MGNTYSTSILNDGITEDNLIKHMNSNKDSLFVVTYKNKPVYYTLDYDQAVNVNSSNVDSIVTEEISNSNNVKVYKIKSIGY